MDYKEIVKQQEEAYAAQQRLETAEKSEKRNIVAGFIDQVYDFLEVIQLDEAFTFSSYRNRLFSGYKLTPQESIDWYRNNAKGDWRQLITSIERWMIFGIDEAYIPFVKFHKEISDAKAERYTNVEAFARAFTNYCLQKRNKPME